MRFQCCVGDTGNPWDSSGVPGTLGWEGQWCCVWDTENPWDSSGVPGGKDSGIPVLCETEWESPGGWEDRWDSSAVRGTLGILWSQRSHGKTSSESWELGDSRALVKNTLESPGLGKGTQ